MTHKLPTNDGDGHPKRACALNWHKNEENCLIEKFMDKCEILQAELKGAEGKGGQVMAQKKDQIWQKITDAINRYLTKCSCIPFETAFNTMSEIYVIKSYLCICSLMINIRTKKQVQKKWKNIKCDGDFVTC